MTRDRIHQFLAQFEQKRVLVIGDIMLDRFVWGSVTRISPEAPVPVVHVQREEFYPGGAANVARNLAPFTKFTSLVGLAGEDEYAKTLQDELSKGNIANDGILRDPSFETIVKTRIFARQQQVVRVDRERPGALSEEQQQTVIDYLMAKIGQLDAIILEDYGKGMMQQPLVDKIVEIATSNEIQVTADPNPNNQLSWNGVTVLKPNRLEAFRMADTPEPPAHDDPLQDQALLEVGEQLLQKWAAKMILITLGEHGMMLFERDAKPQHVPVRAREVFDVSGAGDTAIALLTLALTAGASPIEAVEVSNYASGTVVGKLGTATLTPDELREAVPTAK